MIILILSLMKGLAMIVSPVALLAFKSINLLQ